MTHPVVRDLVGPMDSPAEARSTAIAWALLLILIVVGTGTVLMFLQNYGPGSMMLSTACLCLTLLARDPSNRYPSPSEAIEDLERFLTRDGSAQLTVESLVALFCAMIDEALRLMRLALDELGQHLLIFPQGTRSRRLTRGHSGLVQVAQHLGATIVPVGSVIRCVVRGSGPEGNAWACAMDIPPSSRSYKAQKGS